MKRRSAPVGRRGRHRPLDLRRRLLLAGWLLIAGLILVRSVDLQVTEAAEWRRQAERQHRDRAPVPAARGSILDRDGIALALSHETFHVGVAPHELADREEAAASLQEALDISEAEARRLVAPERGWVPVPGRFPPRVREALAGVRGVYVERELRRFYPQGELGRGLLGGVVDEWVTSEAGEAYIERGTGGIEQEFESHLRGRDGAEIVARDSGGRPIPGETWRVEPPLDGGSVVLSIDVALQEIAKEALEESVRSTGARGGDLLVTDPHTGEILAMVSVQDGESRALGGINTPYEPGSTLKPFTVATLLREDLVALSDSVDTGNGTWTVNRRTITDVSAVGKVTLARALQVSSNVGIAKAARSLAPDQQYEALRDFGFGVPTGVPLPGEASGTLRRPDGWSRQSPQSLAIGYEIAVTPIQMAMAYGALANGGVLMEPRLVRQLRGARGEVVREFEPSAVRRVIPREVAQGVTSALVEAVADGTGTQARLASFAVAGKSGTSRATDANGRYEPGAYFASFVGFFPAEDPQLVVFVKLDRPQGAYYGGSTAAPVTRATMEAILAAREPPLDRRALAAIAEAQQLRPSTDDVVARDSGAPLPASLAFRSDDRPDPSLAREEGVVGAGIRDGRLAMPELRGHPARSAARRLHALGLNVLWESAGPIVQTIPAAGEEVAVGDSIRLISSRAGPDRDGEGGTRADE